MNFSNCCPRYLWLQMEGGDVSVAVVVPGWSVRRGDDCGGDSVHAGVGVHSDVGTGTGLPSSVQGQAGKHDWRPSLH